MKDPVMQDLNEYHDRIARKERAWEKAYDSWRKDFGRDLMEDMTADAALTISDGVPEELLEAVMNADDTEIGRIFYRIVMKCHDDHARMCADKAEEEA
ncbi:MAG: hypothetical protein GWN14_17445 [candidate division Zixibacteria bacterium]|nr:hypothetical protein [candidate division Zixibacteria bacterium]